MSTITEKRRKNSTDLLQNLVLMSWLRCPLVFKGRREERARDSIGPPKVQDGT